MQADVGKHVELVRHRRVADMKRAILAVDSIGDLNRPAFARELLKVIKPGADRRMAASASVYCPKLPYTSASLRKLSATVCTPFMMQADEMSDASPCARDRGSW